MSKHTPGPWLIGNPTALRPTFTIFNRPFGLGDVAEVYEETNAYLIAAAPDLLEALKDCESLLRSFPLNNYDMSREAMAACKARNAIAKAEGRETP